MRVMPQPGRFFWRIMAKRFTDSRKWNDPFFAELSNKYKLLWIYLLDTCNHAGIFKVNMKMMNFCLNDVFEKEEILKTFGDRIKVINSDKWFIPKFIEFQYGSLDVNSNPHKSVIKILEKERVAKGLVKGCLTLKDKNKDKDKEQDKERKRINKELMRYFGEMHKKETGVPYMARFGKDNIILYELLDVYDEPTLKTLMTEFFESARNPDEWWSDKLSIGVFKSVIPQIIGKIRRKKDV